MQNLDASKYRSPSEEETKKEESKPVEAVSESTESSGSRDSDLKFV